MAIKVIKPSQQPTKFVVTSAAAASAVSGKKVTNPSAPIGTSQNTIQLIQEGSTLRSLQPLTHTQVTQIAKVLKEKTQSEVPPVVCENGPNSTRLDVTLVSECALPCCPGHILTVSLKLPFTVFNEKMLAFTE